jgi:arsenate reductase (thioredoxin)
MEKRTKVLFLSAGDATRGQMAEGQLRAATRDQVIAANSAIDSLDSDRLTAEVMREAGVDISTQKPLQVAQSLKEHFGYVITLFDPSHEKSPVFPFTRNLLRWDLRDPRTANGTPEQRREFLRRLRDELNVRIRDFLGRLPRNRSGRAAA